MCAGRHAARLFKQMAEMFLARAQQLHALGSASRAQLSDLNDDDDGGFSLAWNEHEASRRRDKAQLLRSSPSFLFNLVLFGI